MLCRFWMLWMALLDDNKRQTCFQSDISALITNQKYSGLTDVEDSV
jgi:hypothetical protein